MEHAIPQRNAHQEEEFLKALALPVLAYVVTVSIAKYSSVHLKAAPNRPLRAKWAKTAAPTWLAALLRYGR